MIQPIISMTSEPAGDKVPFLEVRPAWEELRVEFDAAWRRVMDSGRYILGEELEAFESEFASYCGAAFCAGCGSGLDALRLILDGYGIGGGDEVLVSAHTFIATWLAILHAGATPVAIDALPGTFNMDAERLGDAITARTRAVVVVHMYGQPAGMDAILAVAARNGLLVIEDAAQSHGALWKGRRVGSLGDAAAFSFYPSKNLGAFGDGGAVVSSDARLIERVRNLRNYGAAGKHRHQLKGHNSRLDPLQAAFLRVRLPHLDAWNSRRAAIAALYLRELEDCCILPSVEEGAEPVWSLFAIRYGERERLRLHLDRCGIETQIHYPVPPHLCPACGEAGYRPGDMPAAERIAETELSLPIGPHLSPGHVQRVIAAVQAFR